MDVLYNPIKDGGFGEMYTGIYQDHASGYIHGNTVTCEYEYAKGISLGGHSDATAGSNTLRNCYFHASHT